MPFCLKCGREYAEGTQFCSNCGYQLTQAASPSPIQGQSTTQPTSQPAEVSALWKVFWFGVIQVVGLVAGWAVGFYLTGTVFSSVAGLGLGPNSTPAEVSAALGPLFHSITLMVPLTFAIGLVGLAFLALAFRELAGVDRGQFSIPSIFMIVMIVGVAAVGVGVVGFLNSLPDLIAQMPATPGTLPPALAALIGPFLVGLAILAIGGIMALAGIIGGQILGLWRVGERYGQTIIKIGAIFSIIPVLNIAAPVLVMIGAFEAKGRLS